MGIETYVDMIMSYVQIGTNWIRELIGKVIGFTGIDGRLGTMILILAASIFLGHFIAKRFVTKPYSPGYIIWTIIISLLFFMVLVYI